MAIDTYSGLKALIESYVDNQEVVDHVDDFIDLAEVRHKSDIRIREMLTRQEIAVFDRYVDLPTGFLEAKTFRLLTAPDITEMLEVSLHELNRWRTSDSRRPRRFAVHTQIELDSTPDDSYLGEMVFYKALTPLSDTNTSNALLARAPDVYLYGALLETAPFLHHDERVPMWQQMYDRAVAGVNQASTSARRGGPLISRVSGPTP